jgi:hypothetical protein
VTVAKVKVENGPVTIELESDDASPEKLLKQAMGAYKKVAKTPPQGMTLPLPGTLSAQVEHAGYQPLGFSAETT